MAYNYGQNSDKSFGQIILGHYEKILEIGRHELRPYEKIMILSGEKTFVEKEDTRLSFVLSIESLAYALEPYFDKDMKDYFNEHIIFLNGFSHEIIESISDSKLKERLETLDSEKKEDLLIAFQIREAKSLFRQLGHLMKRVDYLKASVFGDASSDDVIEDDEEDSE